MKNEKKFLTDKVWDALLGKNLLKGMNNLLSRDLKKRGIKEKVKWIVRGKRIFLIKIK